MEYWIISCIVVDVGVIIANLIQQFFICCQRKTLSRIEHFLLSLSVSDLIFGMTTLAIDSWYLKMFGEFTNTTPTTLLYTNDTAMVATAIKTKTNMAALCNIAFNSVFLFSILASVFHVMAIAVERLCVIKFPKKYSLFTSFTFKSFTICMIWLSAVLLASFCVVSLHLFDNQMGKHLLGSLLLITASLVFLIDMVVAFYLFKHRNIPQTPNNNCEGKVYMTSTNEEVRVRRETLLFFFMGISFIGCILPIALGLFDRSLYHPISSVLVTFNSLLNPCLYFANVCLDSRRGKRRHRSETTHELLDTTYGNCDNV